MAEDNRSIGTALELNDGTAKSIVHITELSGPELEVGTIDATDYQDTDRFNRFIAGNTDPGEIEATVKYDPAEHGTLLALVGKSEASGSPVTGKLTFPDTSTYEGDMFVSGLGTAFASADSDGLITNTVTIKLSGKPSFTDNASP
jgi:hypothetical protein